ncbi:MAG: HAD family hydrolase [Magnetococcales bacterium]|nr:HAD family hydrolase [Magnetococcales bacterium]
MMQRALFLDRDGVINEDRGYVHRIEEVAFVAGIFDLTRQACALGYRLVVVTNQSGIGRGLYTEEQFHRLTAWMHGEFARQDAPIDRVYFSPYHPTEGVGVYRREDPSRKPGPGMILAARDELQLDLAGSLLIGDRLSDIQAGIAAGVGSNLLLARQPLSAPVALPCQVITTLAEAVSFLRGGPDDR